MVPPRIIRALRAPKKIGCRGQGSSLCTGLGTIRGLFEAHSDIRQKANSRRIDFRLIDAAYNPCSVILLSSKDSPSRDRGASSTCAYADNVR